jgi:hypothetical protein
MKSPSGKKNIPTIAPANPPIAPQRVAPKYFAPTAPLTKIDRVSRERKHHKPDHSHPRDGMGANGKGDLVHHGASEDQRRTGKERQEGAHNADPDEQDDQRPPKRGQVRMKIGHVHCELPAKARATITVTSSSKT